jgi:ribosome silencing factor RsfS/YbeB/iojap
MDAKKLVQYCFSYADNRKGENPTILDVNGLSTVTDFFLIVTGTSQPHLNAIAEEIVEELKSEHDIRPHTIDGNVGTGWVVIDYHDVIVHAMTKEMRDRYDLESLWGDAPRVKPRRPRGMGKKTATVA